ncbi:MAG: glutathione S-transferase family protein [Acidiferrobacterales bacterium]
MGQFINGKWTTEWYQPDEKGRFMRPKTRFHNQITADGSSGFQAEAGRYHLYVSLACPWAHRTLILRKLKKLEHAISLSVVDYLMGEEGWKFTNNAGCIPDTVNNKTYLSEVYLLAKSDYTGRVTVPVLWDKKKKTIVNNESREIIRMFDTEFDAIGDAAVSFYPATLKESIDDTIDAIYEPVNNGVYRSGFATSQQAYEEAVTQLFDALDHWEQVLGKQRYLCGSVITEADWCLFTTLMRFDSVYAGHFKCNLKRIVDYPNLWNYLKDLYQVPGVSETVNMDHIKNHYYMSHESVNPTRIVPKGPLIDFGEAHNRGRFSPDSSDRTSVKLGEVSR